MALLKIGMVTASAGWYPLLTMGASENCAQPSLDLFTTRAGVWSFNRGRTFHRYAAPPMAMHGFFLTGITIPHSCQDNPFYYSRLPPQTRGADARAFNLFPQALLNAVPMPGELKENGLCC